MFLLNFHPGDEEGGAEDKLFAAEHEAVAVAGVRPPRSPRVPAGCEHRQGGGGEVEAAASQGEALHGEAQAGRGGVRLSGRRPRRSRELSLDWIFLFVFSI